MQLKIKSFFSSPLHFTTTHLSSVVNKSLPIEKLRKHVVPFGRSRMLKRTMVDASFDLEGVASDGDDGPPQALASSVVAGGVGAMDTLAVGAQGAAPVAEGAGDTEQRIRLTVPAAHSARAVKPARKPLRCR